MGWLGKIKKAGAQQGEKLCSGAKYLPWTKIAEFGIIVTYVRGG